MGEVPYRCHVSLDIRAPLEVAWGILTDFPDYGRWNPFLIGADAPRGVQVGSPLHLTVRFASGATTRATERIVDWSPPTEGAAGFSYTLDSILVRTGMLSSERHNRLERTPSGCRYTSTEHFRGPLRRFIPLSAIQQGFHDQAEALRWAAEARRSPR